MKILLNLKVSVPIIEHKWNNLSAFEKLLSVYSLL